MSKHRVRVVVARVIPRVVVAAAVVAVSLVAPSRPAAAYSAVRVHTTAEGSFSIWPGLSLTPTVQSWALSFAMYGTVVGDGVIGNEDSVAYQYTGSLGFYSMGGSTVFSSGEDLLDGWGTMSGTSSVSGSGIVSTKAGTGSSFVVAGTGTISATIRYAQYSHDGPRFCVTLFTRHLSIDPDGPGGSAAVQIGDGWNDINFQSCGAWAPTQGLVAAPVTAGSFVGNSVVL